jgi:collagen beta-1,O-galactosyltransferase
MNIDKIYVINLKKNTDRKKNVINLFNKLGGIFNNYVFYEAIIGNELSESQIYEIMSVKSLYNLYKEFRDHSDIKSKGAIGCYLSHYNIWLDVIKNNYKNVLVFEDDIYSDYDYDKILTYINNVPQDYDIALLGYIFLTLNKEKYEINNYWNSTNSLRLMGTHSYLLSNSGAFKLSKKALPMEIQVDSYINYICNINSNIKKYISKKNLFSQNNSTYSTDIQDLCIVCWYTDFSYFIYNNIFVIIALFLLITLIK